MRFKTNLGYLNSFVGGEDKNALTPPYFYFKAYNKLYSDNYKR